MILQNTSPYDVNKRQSNFELLRLLSMFFIVFYHLLRFFIVKEDDAIIYRAIWLPLHVGVICFVLISGYFHIKPSVRGTLKLLLPLLLFYLPLTLWELAHGVGGAKSLMFFSKSPYWFIRTYFFLFLISPLLNNYLTDNKRRLQMLVVFGFIAIYMGSVHEYSLKDGKNIALFIFLYILGDCLRSFKAKYKEWKLKWLLLSYIFYNSVLVVGYIAFAGSILGKGIWLMCFPYCSIGLIANATFLFVIFSKLIFTSKMINWLSASTLSIYILHHQHFILYSLIGPAIMKIYFASTSVVMVLLGLAVSTLLIMTGSIFIDKIFLTNRIINTIEQLINRNKLTRL